MKMTSSEALAKEYNAYVAEENRKYEVLKELDLFVLDNSIRESTVGQVRGHTLENKWKVFKETKKCGFQHHVVASFSEMTTVDDVFIQQLVDAGEDPDYLWAFSEITEGRISKVPNNSSVPIGLKKLQKAGLYNVILEIDLGDPTYDFNKFTILDMCALLKKWIEWCRYNLSPKSKTLVNLRDPPDVFPHHPERVFEVVKYLANMATEIRPIGFILEEPRGKSFPEECGAWTRFIRKTMNESNWKGHLLFHVHEKFGLCDAVNLQGLMNGANGIWASVCTEGAAMGAASSCVTIMNLVRLGNKKVLEKFDCCYLRQAAINVTEITTAHPPDGRQPVFGARATDFVYDLRPEDFDLASFFNEKGAVRMTTLTSPEMIRKHLIDTFGQDDQFVVDICVKMKKLMLKDLRESRKEEYMSMHGLAILFDRAGGKLTPSMRDAMTSPEYDTPHAKTLIAEIRKMWDTKAKVQGDKLLQYENFYNGFMAPYFSCYTCGDTRKVMQAIDMDSDGHVDWAEFLVYIKWALCQYPDTKDTQELLDITFRKGIIPAMRDEYINSL